MISYHRNLAKFVAIVGAVLLQVVGIVWVLIGVSQSIGSENGEWFQRSGSLLVLASVGAEFLLKDFIRATEESADVFVNSMPVIKKKPLSKVIMSLHLFPFTGIVLGTAIWGYGDLLFDG